MTTTKTPIQKLKDNPRQQRERGEVCPTCKRFIPYYWTCDHHHDEKQKAVPAFGLKKAKLKVHLLSAAEKVSNFYIALPPSKYVTFLILISVPAKKLLKMLRGRKE